MCPAPAPTQKERDTESVISLEEHYQHSALTSLHTAPFTLFLVVRLIVNYRQRRNGLLLTTSCFCIVMIW